MTIPEDFVSEEMILNYHLMHPGGDSAPGDPNAAFCLDETYHLHYILQHPFKDGRSFSFVHVTSSDLLHWTWQKTKLQPSFTGHGMFSGTGLVTLEGQPAAIYHGQASGWNQIAIADDRSLSTWQKPYAVQPMTRQGEAAQMHHWDPDCFLIGNTYYAISGGRDQPLIKSDDLHSWTLVGDFLRHELPDAAIGEDISCPNFFPLDGRWVLLCISHPMGCRYYIGDWDVDAEQFVPESHGRMNWRRPNQSIYETTYRDFFAPESVLTPDGRRVMWAWLATLDGVAQRSMQSLPRELSLGDEGQLRIRPLRELESLRTDAQVMSDVQITPPEASHGNWATQKIATLQGDTYEIRISVDRSQATRKRFGVQLFADEDHPGLEVMLTPETGSLRVGETEAPFAVADLPEDEDIDLRIFIDKYLVEIFINDRQAVVASFLDYRIANQLRGYTYGDPTVFRQIEIWKMKSTNQGLLEAREHRIWEPDTT
ncbi:MAG: glycoside hydrolase family 32 protein [Candidatus Latescibacterota bacterium]|nr:glycoside hydrolase family 32 protein [Candidatus Latescibacterota bacterium]